MIRSDPDEGRCPTEWLSRASGLPLRCVLDERHESECRGPSGWRNKTELQPGDLVRVDGYDQPLPVWCVLSSLRVMVVDIPGCSIGPFEVRKVESSPLHGEGEKP